MLFILLVCLLKFLPQNAYTPHWNVEVQVSHAVVCLFLLQKRFTKLGQFDEKLFIRTYQVHEVRVICGKFRKIFRKKELRKNISALRNSTKYRFFFLVVDYFY